MKLLHISDLHLGRRWNEYSLLDDQKYMLRQILSIIDSERPRAVLIAGDVFDKSMPAAEAVAVFDEFLVELAKRNQETFIISGNHDSPERIAYGGRLMASHGIHLSPVYAGAVQPITLDGQFDFYLLPFVRPTTVRNFHPDAEIESYSDAVRTAVQAMPVNPGHRRILIAHQYITGAAPSESEESFVGGTGNVDKDVFDGFDYVALGHIHRSQWITPRMHYCGTPLMYSLKEINQPRTATIVDLEADGSVSHRTVPIPALHGVHSIAGKFDEIIHSSYADIQDDYIHVTLTDETDIPNAFVQLHAIFRHFLDLTYDNKRTREERIIGTADTSKTPMEMFEELYETQNNQSLNDAQRKIVADLIKELTEGAL